MKKVILSALGVCVSVGLGFYILTQPPSVEYLSEHPEEFRFEDYGSDAERQNVLREIFPIGTSREKVEALFVGALNMSYSDDYSLKDNPYGMNRSELLSSENYIIQDQEYGVDYRFYGEGAHTNGTGNWRAFGYGEYQHIVFVAYSKNNITTIPIKVRIAGVKGSLFVGAHPEKHNTGERK